MHSLTLHHLVAKYQESRDIEIKTDTKRWKRKRRRVVTGDELEKLEK